MPNRHRFPIKFSEKNIYFNRVIPFLMAAPNRSRLGLSGVTELDEANANYNAEWKVKYPLSVNDNTATKTIRQERNASAKFLQEKLRLVFEEIPSSALTTEDRNTLNLPLRKKGRTKRHRIDSIPYGRLGNRGDGQLHVVVRTNHDSSRPSIHPQADGIQIVYVFDILPQSPDQCTLQHFSKDAGYVLKTGSENVGRKFFAFLRWVNASDPEKSGPFSDLLSTVLGGSAD